MGKITKIEPIKALVQPKKRVAAYARVSLSTEKLLHSMSAQVSYYSELIQKNDNWIYAGVYADTGISGVSTEGRCEFARMLADCEAGKIDIILCKSISRFARNTVDLLSTVRHLKELGIEVRFEKENINSMSGDGELMLSILASFAQEESRSISENCKWGIRKRFQTGEIGTCNKHILGYRYDEDEKKYVIIPEEAKTIRWMFQMYIDGLSFQKIADTLNNAGIHTSLGCNFQEASVRTLIFNEVYAGDTLRQKSYMESPLTKKKVKNNGELPKYYIADTHEAIIDRETYAKVQQEMARRASLINPTYCFSGKIKCAECGRSYARMKRVVKGKEYVGWTCRTNKEKGKNSCPCPTISDIRLKSICAELLGIESFDEEAEETFKSSVIKLVIDSIGNIEMHMVGGKTRKWIKPPKQPTKAEIRAKEQALKQPQNIFDGKIFCGKCGCRFGRSISDTNDGGHLYWYCKAKSHHAITCDSVNYADSEIREIFCTVMEKETFSDEYFTQTIDKLIVQPTGSIDFHLKDGTVKHYETFKLRNNIHESTCTQEFTGKIICASCGDRLHQYSCNGKYFYWRCPGKNHSKVNAKSKAESTTKQRCKCKDQADCNIRKVTAYVLGTDKFDERLFSKQIDYIKAYEDGSLEFIFKDGRTRKWQKS